ncbi:unnamed protein product [Leptosia nina]|uniref:Carboxylesterase type B domain-containing protein n=1 Tax=Leptosia nina TaxID=320188 RepID=A0AAV1JV10_9NEOP
MAGAKLFVCIVTYCILMAECHHSKEPHQKPMVTVKEGRLRGTVGTIYDGSTYFSFKGIPYAEAPVGRHRFQSDPLPPKPWQGVRDASQHGPICTQYDFTVSQYFEGSEQCLFVNIYTKSLQPQAKIPVMVFIHGGSYMSGSGNSDTFSPDLLLEHNVIFATINYRLELLGFLSVDTPEVPGSGGMKDTVAALRWIKENIAKFGGDPDNITIFGESSGASSVTYLMMAPSAKGLFSKVIAQSGTCFEDWAQARNMKERAFRAAKVLGKDTNDVGELLEFFRGLPALNLTNLTEKTLTEEEQYRGLPEQFIPVIEKKFRGVEPFMDEDPVQKVLKGRVNRVPIMLGYNSGEGISIISEEIKKLDVKNRNVSYFVPRSVVEVVSQEKAKEFGERIQRFYGGDKGITKDNPGIVRDVLTDTNFAYNTHRFAYMYSKYAPVYMYRFNYETDLNVIKRYSSYKDLAGVSHADDLFYLFYNNLNKDVYDSQPKLRDIAYEVTKLWTDFAKYGNPTPDGSLGVDWQPYTASGKEYYNIQEKYSVGHYADRDRIEFWNQIYKEAGLPHIKGGQQAPIVSVEQGRLRGTIERIYSGSSYFSFKGITYAEAPIGKDRFKSPLPPKPWIGIREAKEHGPICAQLNTTTLDTIGSEQCLFLNVYTKSIDPRSKLPVLVFIHGGSFMFGSGNSDTFSPDLLIQHDVIFVTINYRQELLGYLSLYIPEVPGNAGMRDQIMALRWIKENIARFGGDPDNVTIFGESSGAAAVTYLIVSPMGKGLFNKAIVESGVCLQDWAQGRDMRPRAFRAGKVLGKDTKYVAELLKHLRSLPSGSLSNLPDRTMTDEEKLRGLPERFVPVVEKKFPEVEAFIDEDPVQILIDGKANTVPLMLGYNSGEGISIISYEVPRLEVKNANLSLFVPRDIAERVSLDKMQDMGRRIKEFYAGKGNFSENDPEVIRDMATNIHFAYNTHRFAYLYKRKNNPVYMYKFNYDTDLNILKNVFNPAYKHLEGATHGDELFYLFYNALNKAVLDGQPKLRDITYRLTKMWTNFAKTGNPTPDDDLGIKWPQYTRLRKEYLTLQENSVAGFYADRTQMDFWNQLYKEAGLAFIED